MSELTTTITCVLMLCSMATPKPDINYDCRRISRVFVFTMGMNKIVWLKPTLLVQSIRFRKILSNQTPDMQKAIDRFFNDFFAENSYRPHKLKVWKRKRDNHIRFYYTYYVDVVWHNRMHTLLLKFAVYYLCIVYVKLTCLKTIR